MKYSIVISASKTSFGPIVFREGLKKNIMKANKLGYDGVELAVKNPELIDLKGLKKIIEKTGMVIVAVGTGQLYFDEGLSFSDPAKVIRNEAVKRVCKIIDFANNFQSSVIIGAIRGRITGNNIKVELEKRKAEKRINECLKKCMDYSMKFSTQFLLEPANRYEINIFNTLEETVNFLNGKKGEYDMERIGILADTFHMNIEEPIIAESIYKYFDFIKHLHFADSNRWAPGYGHINFKEILDLLEKNNYKRFISFEMFPLPESSDFSATKALKYIKKLQKD
jgi:sugar phosphate isomerase/epimerase